MSRSLEAARVAHKHITVSLPKDEVELSQAIESTLPPNTNYIVHVLSVNNPNQEQPSKKTPALVHFSEKQTPTRRANGPVLTAREYEALLTQNQVPLAPKNELWTPEKVLWVAKPGNLAVIEFPENSQTKQTRVTRSTKQHIPNGTLVQSIPNRKEYAKVLVANGFPQEAFNPLRADASPSTERERFFEPVLSDLGIIWDTVRDGMGTIFRSPPDGQFIDSVRTNHPRQRARR